MGMFSELNGVWYESTDVVATVRDQTVYWPHGLTSLLEPMDKNVQLVLRGEVVTGEINPDGSIQWNNGDAWKREDQVEPDGNGNVLKLNGRWCERTEDVVAVIRNQTVEWPHGLTSELELTEEGFQMVLKGQVLRATRRADGDIQWSNGDVWQRDYKFYGNASPVSAGLGPAAVVNLTAVKPGGSPRRSPLCRQNTPGTFASDATPSRKFVRSSVPTGAAMNSIHESQDIEEEENQEEERPLKTKTSLPGTGKLVFPETGVPLAAEDSSVDTSLSEVVVAPFMSLVTVQSDSSNGPSQKGLLPKDALRKSAQQVIDFRAGESGAIVDAPTGTQEALLPGAGLHQVRASLMNPIPQPAGDEDIDPCATLSSIVSGSGPSPNQASPRSGAVSGKKQGVATTSKVRSSSASPRGVHSNSPVSTHGLSKTKFTSGSSVWAKNLGREIGEKFQSNRSNSISPRNERSPMRQGSPKSGRHIATDVNIVAQPTLFSRGSTSPRAKSPPRIGALADPPTAEATSPTSGRGQLREKSAERTPPIHHQSRATHKGLSAVKYTSGSSAWAKTTGREIGDQFAPKPRGSVSTLLESQRGTASPRSASVSRSPRTSPRALGALGATRTGSVQIPSPFTRVQVLSPGGGLPPRTDTQSLTMSVEMNYAFSPMSQTGSPIQDVTPYAQFGTLGSPQSRTSGRKITPTRQADMSPRTLSSPRGTSRREGIQRISSQKQGSPKVAAKASMNRASSLLSPRTLRGRGEQPPAKWI
eukprot:GEMP01008153.1.p1 GENE.GEMP01008153.1~~GEMP01008153.1.p1  ORF type:complete len:757 (+),score=169.19 GEMP01008153.1:238-2508(+)